MSLTSSELAAQCWDTLRTERAAGEPVPPPWSQLPDWDREDVIDVVELYRQGASAEETYTAQRDAVLDAGVDLEPDVVPWAELTEAQRARGDRMFALVQELDA